MILLQSYCDNNDDNFVTTINNNHHHALLVESNGSYGMGKKTSFHIELPTPTQPRHHLLSREKRYTFFGFSTIRTSIVFFVSILLIMRTSWTLPSTTTTFTTTTTTNTATQPVAVFVAAWMTSTTSIRRNTIQIPTNKYKSMTSKQRSTVFTTKQYGTNQIYMTTNSNENDIDFYNINYNNPLRNSTTTLSKKSSVVLRPAFGQVKHRSKVQPQSWVRPTLPSTPTNTNTKIDIPTTVPPQRQQQQQQQFQLSGRNKKMNSDGSITSLHTSRIQNAGRVGTKRYINPCKVYFGNLSYQITDKSILQNFVIQQLGLPKHVLLKECNIVTDWKTNQSKGYGFVIFTEPIYATIAITKLHGTSWYNRTITVNQGVHKQNMEELQAIYQNAYRKQQLRLEQEQQNINQQPVTCDDEIIYMDAKEAALLKHLDPDLLEGVQIIKTSTSTVDVDAKQKKNDKTKGKQSKVTLEVDDDDDDDGYDYDDEDEIEYDYSSDDDIYVDDIDVEMDETFDSDDDYDDDDNVILSDDRHIDDDSGNDDKDDEEAVTIKNRQQRRDDAKSKKKIKLPRKGFG